MKTKKSKKPIIELIGNNATEVTGSLIRITTAKGTQILLDCGGIQGGTVEEDYRSNLNALNTINVDKIEYVFVAHNHYDHVGLLPSAVRQGFNGKIITTPQTAKLMQPLLIDCAFINNKNFEYLSNKYGRTMPVLYTEKDVHDTFDYVYEYDFGETYDLDDEVSFKLLKNNHVLGACSIELFIKDESNHQYKIFYSSDLGNVAIPNRPYLSEVEYCRNANVEIFESTYGNRDEHLTKKDRENEIKILKREIEDCCLNRLGSVIIPCFSFARSQEMMTLLYQIYKDDEKFKGIDFIVDSKLTKEIIKVYEKVLDDKDKELFNEVLSWKNFKIISDFKTETLQVLKDKKPKVVISSSGMCNAGHSVEYIKNYLENERNSIIFCGYASENTLAGKLRKDTKTITIDKNKRPYKKKARIITLQTFSSHMQKHDLVNYICSVNCDKVILVHGDKKAKESLKEACRKELSKRNKTTNVIVSQRNMKVSL